MPRPWAVAFALLALSLGAAAAGEREECPAPVLDDSKLPGINCISLNHTCIDQGVFVLFDPKFSPAHPAARPVPVFDVWVSYNWPSHLGGGCASGCLLSAGQPACIPPRMRPRLYLRLRHVCCLR